MIHDNGHWSIGFMIGMPVTLICAFLTVIFLVTFIHGIRTNQEDYTIIGGGSIAAFMFVMFAIGAICLFPYNASYHKYYAVTGTVESTNHRLISDSNKGMSERYVIKYKESGTLYGCDDTRCSLAVAGKTIQLKCKKDYVWQSTPGWVCNYDQKD